MKVKVLEVSVNGVMIRKVVPVNQHGVVERSIVEKLTYEAAKLANGENVASGIKPESLRSAWFSYRSSKTKLEGEVIEVNPITFFRIRNLQLNEHHGVSVFVVRDGVTSWLPINVSMYHSIDLITEFVEEELGDVLETENIISSFAGKVYDAVYLANLDKNTPTFFKLTEVDAKVLVDHSDSFDSLNPLLSMSETESKLILELVEKREHSLYKQIGK